VFPYFEYLHTKIKDCVPRSQSTDLDGQGSQQFRKNVQQESVRVNVDDA
jgi:hypothetical protein